MQTNVVDLPVNSAERLRRRLAVALAGGDQSELTTQGEIDPLPRILISDICGDPLGTVRFTGEIARESVRFGVSLVEQHLRFLRIIP